MSPHISAILKAKIIYNGEIMKIVNENGIEQIAEFLRNTHKQGNKIVNDNDMLAAWIVDAEYSLCQHDIAQLEVKCWDSATGHTEVFTVSDEGISDIG